MKLLILFLLFSCSITHAEIVSRNMTLNYHNIQVVNNYSAAKNTGLIRVQLCSSCEKKELILDRNTRFTIDDKPAPLEELLHTRLSQPTEAVRIQYNYKDNTVSFIYWNYTDPEGEI